MTIALPEDARIVLDAPNYAVIGTLNPDGSPNTAVVCVVLDGDTILISTTTTRQIGRNLARDNRVSLSIYDATNPLHSVSIRGTVELDDDPRKELSAQVAHKYAGAEPPAEPAEWRRVSVRITPEKVFARDLGRKPDTTTDQQR